jgi:hypothetical protein
VLRLLLMLTYVIVAILDEKGDPLTVKIGAAMGLLQTIPGTADMGKEVAIGKRTT